MDYEVKLDIFEGPMDLLLHLIHKNEMDIFDIPIATITEQYLGYIDMMKALNVNMAGDFLLMASTLIYIKSRMLLPGFKTEDEEEDPRVEIVRPLLEYMRFKEIAGEISERELLDRDVFARKIPPDFNIHAKEQEPPLDVNLFQLMDAFKRVVEQNHPGAQLDLQLEKWSVKDKTEFIISLLREKKVMYFREIFGKDRTVSEFVVTFLALLELVHTGLVKVFQPTLKSDIRLVPSFDERESRDDD